MEQDIIKKLEEQNKKLEEIYKTMQKLKNYFRWSLIITIIAVVLPAIGLALVIPVFFNSLSSAYGGLKGLGW